MAETAAVETRNLAKVFPGYAGNPVTVLERVSLEIRDNEFFTLLGPSGCGKTTLLRLTAGFDQPSAGSVLLFGEPIQGLTPDERPINTVFQSYMLFPHMTVEENVGFGLRMLKRPPDEIQRRTEHMLSLVRLSGLNRRTPSQLSGGQQQRVALARALAPAPRVLLLDEPLSALDLKLRMEMRIELKKLQRETGITFIFVTHDQDEALTMSDRIAVLADGKVHQVGDPVEIYEHPVDRFVADFVGETNLVAATVESADSQGVKCCIDGGAALVLDSARRLAAGDKVTISIRPERIRLTAGRATHDGAMAARVVNSVYGGVSSSYLVRTQGGLDLLAREPNNGSGCSRYAEGETLSVTLPLNALRLLED